MEDKFNKKYSCPVEFTLDVIGGKWKSHIIWYLEKKEVLRYGEIKKKLKTITHKMLSQQLKELTFDGMLIRKDYHQVPPKVEYYLTDKGKSAHLIIDAMNTWGLHNMPNENASSKGNLTKGVLDSSSCNKSATS